jgi:hypothetical protein
VLSAEYADGQISLEFSEPVLVSAKDLSLIDADAQSVVIDKDSFVHVPGGSVATLDLSGLTVGPYTLTLSGSQIQDLAANFLDGEFDGHAFPTGDGVQGGNFSFTFTVTGAVNPDLDFGDAPEPYPTTLVKLMVHIRLPLTQTM